MVQHEWINKESLKMWEKENYSIYNNDGNGNSNTQKTRSIFTHAPLSKCSTTSVSSKKKRLRPLSDTKWWRVMNAWSRKPD